MVLDKLPDTLSQRVANRVYEDCRAGNLKVCGFPDYNPIVSALQNTKPEDNGKSYQVAVKKHDRLVILQAMASKWLDSEYKDEATQLIEEHNNKFNQNGEYWQEAEERPDELLAGWSPGWAHWVFSLLFCLLELQ